MKNLGIEIKWAIVFLVMTLLWMMFEKSMGWHDEGIADHASYTNLYAIPAIMVYVLALLDKKKNFYGGQMTYKQGFMTGLIITLIVAILSPLNQYIISTIITPDYFTNVIEYSVSNGIMEQTEAEAYFSLKNYMLISVIGAVMMGLITTLVVALFVRSKR
ncbi:DUF4199 domain-containing protein [Algoriphagus limi]|uniref:DUF4199 domain-containing protein n=1 Tax=Algoriphagus limi TaxID=2975273 RepID=A0ABT2G942_9BACT|nr:DUF4199 domain-containing protein [Algoriphagus limi]MCS5490525.1 DUF4199 domain-containing protein [Algoriphagus limi]